MPLLTSFQPLLANYVNLLGELAANVALVPPSPAAAESPTLADMGAAVALLASCLRAPVDGSGRRAHSMDEAAIIDGVSAFIVRRAPAVTDRYRPLPTVTDRHRPLPAITNRY